MDKYRPESRQAKRDRLRKRAEAVATGKPDAPTKRQNWIRQGINTVTTLVEQKRAKLVVIAHDVEPIEVCVELIWIFSPKWWHSLKWKWVILYNELFNPEIIMYSNRWSKACFLTFFFLMSDCSFSAILVQKDGSAVLHREEQSSIGYSGSKEDLFSNLYNWCEYCGHIFCEYSQLSNWINNFDYTVLQG